MQVIHVEHRSPEALYIDISQSAMRSIARIQSFTSLVKDPKSQEVFARANESRTKNEEGIAGWLVTQHPDWLDRAVEDGVKEMKIDEDQTNDESHINLSLDEATPVIQRFREEHPHVEVLVDYELKSIKVYMFVEHHAEL